MWGGKNKRREQWNASPDYDDSEERELRHALYRVNHVYNVVVGNGFVDVYVTEDFFSSDTVYAICDKYGYTCYLHQK